MKFAFDRMIDHMLAQDWPPDIFHPRNSLSGQALPTQCYFLKLLGFPGVRELYEMHHKVAGNSEFYFRNKIYYGKRLSSDERKQVVDFCQLAHLISN